MRAKPIIAVFFGILLLMSFTACGYVSEMSFDGAQDVFDQDREELQAVCDWLLASDYQQIVISSPYEKMFADYSKIRIDEKILPALKYLFDKRGYVDVYKDSEDNTICFGIWSESLDRGGGILYAIDNSQMPTTDYMTQCSELSETGWYYFESDYNEWRSNHR